MATQEATLIEAGLRAGLYEETELARLRPLARQRQLGLLALLCRERRFPPTAFYRALAQMRGLAFCELVDLRPDETALRRLLGGLAARCRTVPCRPCPGAGKQASAGVLAAELLFVTDRPDDTASLDLVRRAVGRPGVIVITDPASLDGMLAGPDAGLVETDAVEVFDRVMKSAWLYRASDVHFEPMEGGLRVRLRVDGQMRENGPHLAQPLAGSVVSRIKVLAQMDIGEQRAAQDGSFDYTLAGWDKPALELRAASVPVVEGERVSLRILGDTTQGMSLSALGMPDFMLERLRGALHHPHGMLLVTGPTGSGKSTTLYAALRELDAARLNILTVEDPVEQRVPGISQTQVSQKINFAGAVRAFLRHDPDVILVGEVRDHETADAAIKAAMTGHMVLTTLHTNHAAGAITRLADIGCERFLLSSTVLGVLAQRLVRRLCPACMRKGEASAEESALLAAVMRRRARDGSGTEREEQEREVPGQQAPSLVWRPVGCAACGGSGYAGRVGIFESFWIDGATAERIQSGASERTLINGALDYHRLADDACAKVAAGLTSVDEVRPLLQAQE